MEGEPWVWAAAHRTSVRLPVRSPGGRHAQSWSSASGMLASDGVKVPRFEAQIIRRECRLPPPAIHCPRLWMRPHANPCCLCAAGFLPFHCFVGKFATPPDFNAVDGAGRCSCPTPGVPFQTACPPLNCRRGGRRAETWRTWRRSCGAGGAMSWWRTSRLPRCRHRPGAAPLLAARAQGLRLARMH